MLCQFPSCEQVKWTMFVYTLNSFILMQPPTNGHLERIAELFDNIVDEIQNGANNAELKLFLEVEFSPDLRPLAPPEKTKDEILLFFKLYDPMKEELRFVGRSFVKAVGKLTEILRSLNEMAGFSPNEEIELFEEIKFEPNVMCEHVDKRLTFRGSQVCFLSVAIRFYFPFGHYFCAMLYICFISTYWKDCLVCVLAQIYKMFIRRCILNVLVA